MSQEEITAFRAFLVETMEKQWQLNLPTQYESPFNYAILRALVEQIEAAARDFSYILPARPVFGSLPSDQINARAIAVPSSEEYLVVFEQELFIFAMRLSKVVARAIPFEEVKGGSYVFRLLKTEAEIAKHLSENPVVLQRFRDALTPYLIEDKLLRSGIQSALRYSVDQPYGQAAKVLLDAMELFILGHEYGHLIKHHFSQGTRTASLLGEQSVEELIYNLEQEIEADLLGLQLMLRAMQKRKIDITLSFWGADFFFCSIEVIARAVALRRTGDENALSWGSHPPPHVRRELLKQALRNSAPEKTAKTAIEISTYLEMVMNVLWKSVQPGLQKRFHEDGGKLFPRS
jgi:hypothetical protein